MDEYVNAQIVTSSIGSITAITNQSGAVVERRSFDAWGRPRHPDNWTYNNVPQMSILDRGYTGHEHLPQFDIINMNGRMYDPLINRFLSPDPYVQNVGSQGFNRYSYCFNNPLKYTDPTGKQTDRLPRSFDINWWDNPYYEKTWININLIPSQQQQGGGRISFDPVSTFPNSGFQALPLAPSELPYLSNPDLPSVSMPQWYGDIDRLGGIDRGLPKGNGGAGTPSGKGGSGSSGGSGSPSGGFTPMAPQMPVPASIKPNNINNSNHEIIAKYNEYVKISNDGVSLLVDIANYFTNQEIAALKTAGIGLKVVGWSNAAVDGYLTIDAIRNGGQWGWHLYDTGIGVVGLLGLPGLGVATTVNSYVQGARFVNKTVNWVNTEGERRFINHIFRLNFGY